MGKINIIVFHYCYRIEREKVADADVMRTKNAKLAICYNIILLYICLMMLVLSGNGEGMLDSSRTLA